MDEMTTEKQTMVLTGAVTIAQAAGLREELLQALGQHRELLIDLSQITGIDVSVLQLLCAAHHSAHDAGRRLVLGDGGNPLLRNAVSDAGLASYFGCNCDSREHCLWSAEGRNDD